MVVAHLSRFVWRVAGGVGLVLAITGRARAASLHPLHTTLAEVTVDPSGGVLRAVIRVFTDDLLRAASREARSATAADAAAFAYVQSTFVLTDRRGRRIPLRSCGTRHTADLSWVCVEAVLPAGIEGITLRSAVLCDQYDDQVNIVRATVKGRLRSMLFTRADGPRPLS